MGEISRVPSHDNRKPFRFGSITILNAVIVRLNQISVETDLTHLWTAEVHTVSRRESWGNSKPALNKLLLFVNITCAAFSPVVAQVHFAHCHFSCFFLHHVSNTTNLTFADELHKTKVLPQLWQREQATRCSPRAFLRSKYHHLHCSSARVVMFIHECGAALKKKSLSFIISSVIFKSYLWARCSLTSQ